MDKQITVYFHDLCLTDYFCGHHKPVLQYPVDGNTTRKELYSGYYRDWETDRKSTRLNSSHSAKSRMPSSA